MTNPLSPLNDFVRQVFVQLIDSSTGVLTPCTTGSLTGFLAASNAPDAAPADPAWTANGTHIGGANGFPDGTWQFQIDASVLTVAKCRAAFASGTPPAIPYFIVQRTDDFRVVERLKYVDVRSAQVE